ncbi:MAG: deoxyribose-phosphate aldolase [Clostridia bacterium]
MYSKFTKADILKMVDHTILKQTATWEDVRKICDEGIKHKVASVCIPPCYIVKAKEYTKGAVPICTVIGFPNGNMTINSKVFETQDAVNKGAEEIDMVINIGKVKEHDYNYVLHEIKQVKRACQGKLLKVIIETCLLDESEKIHMCKVVTDSGAEYIKTSTGFSLAGATLDDVRLMKKYVGPHVKIKAAGGIASFIDARNFIDAGANRLGTSRLI